MPNLEGIGLQNFSTFTSKETLEFAPKAKLSIAAILAQLYLICMFWRCL
jgi:hypothetical protein